MRGFSAVLALTSIIILILVVLFVRGGEEQAVSDESPVAASASSDTAEPTAEPTEEPAAQPTVVPTEQPTVVPTEQPTAVPTEQPTPDSATVVRLPTDEPDSEEDGGSDADASMVWCIGPRHVDVRSEPQDGAEIVGQIDEETCGLEQFAVADGGWIPVRSGSGDGAIEGWIWESELVPS